MIPIRREQYRRAERCTWQPAADRRVGRANLMTILVVQLERAIPLSTPFAETA